MLHYDWRNCQTHRRRASCSAASSSARIAASAWRTWGRVVRVLVRLQSVDYASGETVRVSARRASSHWSLNSRSSSRLSDASARARRLVPRHHSITLIRHMKHKVNLRRFNRSEVCAVVCESTDLRVRALLAQPELLSRRRPVGATRVNNECGSRVTRDHAPWQTVAATARARGRARECRWC